MIKGVNLQVVEVNDTGSDCFDKILFFVKPEYAFVSENKIRQEATKIASSMNSVPPKRYKRSNIRLILLIGSLVFLGMVLGALFSFSIK